VVNLFLVSAPLMAGGPYTSASSARASMEREVAARVATRNAAFASIDWHFTTADARIKLNRLYSIFSGMTVH
jgi:hypothetical protein